MFPRIVPALVSTLAAATLLAACGTPAPDLDLSLQHASQQGRFVVRMEPPDGATALHQIHTWKIHLAAADGRPVSQAAIGFDGGMPQHGHGFPTRPRVTRELAPGVYALEGVKFSMSGWWDMRLSIQAGGSADSAVFNVVLTDAGLRR